MRSWLVFDLETRNADEKYIQAAIAAWRPPGNCSKADTIDAKRQEAATRIRDRAALLDASPIICIALSMGESQAVFHAMGDGIGPVEGWPLISSPDERTMLMLFRHYLDEVTTPDTILVIHNRGFDIPHLRNRYIGHRLKLPEILRPRLNDEPPICVMDTMYLIKGFSMELRDEKYVSLNQVAAVLGIDRPKQIISGADVPRLYQEGQYQAICTYAAIDCATTARAYSLMTGQAADLV